MRIHAIALIVLIAVAFVALPKPWPLSKEPGSSFNFIQPITYSDQQEPIRIVRLIGTNSHCLDRIAAIGGFDGPPFGGCGVIGLGGSMATYNSRFRHIIYYEIDDQIRKLNDAEAAR